MKDGQCVAVATKNTKKKPRPPEGSIEKRALCEAEGKMLMDRAKTCDNGKMTAENWKTWEAEFGPRRFKACCKSDDGECEGLVTREERQKRWGPAIEGCEAALTSYDGCRIVVGVLPSECELDWRRAN